MGKYTLFKDLLSYYEGLTKEEELVLCIHFLLLNAGLENVWKEASSDILPQKEKRISVSEKYMQYETEESKGKFFISKILVNPDWRKDNNNYKFNYKNEDNDSNYILNVLNIGKSLIVQLINASDATSLQSLPIDVDEYIQNNKSSEMYWTRIHVAKLESVLMEELLNKFGLNKKYNRNTNGENKFNSFTESSCNTCRGLMKEKENALKDELQQIRNTIAIDHNTDSRRFDDKQPSVLHNVESSFKHVFKSHPIQFGEDWISPDETKLRGLTPEGILSGHVSPDLLKPDGMLFGPNHKLFNPSNIHYDPMGPFGVEPNCD